MAIGSDETDAEAAHMSEQGGNRRGQTGDPASESSARECGWPDGIDDVTGSREESQRLISTGVELVGWRTKSNSPGLCTRMLRSLIDILVAAVILVLTWPIIVCVSLYIKKYSEGPVLFRQIRIKRTRRRSENVVFFRHPGTKEYHQDRRKSTREAYDGPERRKNSCATYYCSRKSKEMKRDRRKVDLGGEPFTFYKFRTMYVDARERFGELYEYNYGPDEIESLRFKKEGDPRVPEALHWLRKTSLDELPNLLNVLRGDMSLVGPRPDIPEMVKYYAEWQRAKFDVKPGITGISQITGRGHLSFQDTLKGDIEYVRSQSLILDVKILLKTIQAMVSRHGAF